MKRTADAELMQGTWHCQSLYKEQQEMLQLFGLAIILQSAMKMPSGQD